MKNLYAFLVILIVFISCKESPTSTIVDSQKVTYSFFPLKVGNKWKYHYLKLSGYKEGYYDWVNDTTRGLIEFEIINSVLVSQHNVYKCTSTFYDSSNNNSSKSYYTFMKVSDSLKITCDSSYNNPKNIRLFGPLKTFKEKAEPTDTTLNIWLGGYTSHYIFKKEIGLMTYQYHSQIMIAYEAIEITLLEYLLK